MYTYLYKIKAQEKNQNLIGFQLKLISGIKFTNALFHDPVLTTSVFIINQILNHIPLKCFLHSGRIILFNDNYFRSIIIDYAKRYEL